MVFYLIFFDGNNVLYVDAMHEAYAVYAHFHTEFRQSIHQSLHMFRVSCYAIISEARQLTVPKQAHTRIRIILCRFSWPHNDDSLKT